jgi:hypothetical protein
MQTSNSAELVLLRKLVEVFTTEQAIQQSSFRDGSGSVCLAMSAAPQKSVRLDFD